jgi:hypothetical protein
MNLEDEDIVKQVAQIRGLTVRLFQFQAVTLARIEALTCLVAGLHTASGANIDDVKAILAQKTKAIESEWLATSAEIMGDLDLIPPNDEWWDRPPR